MQSSKVTKLAGLASPHLCKGVILSLSILLFLVACGGDEKKLNCSVEFLPKDCSGYEAISNSYLAKARIDKPVENFLIRPLSHGSSTLRYGKGEGITEVTYGTIDMLADKKIYTKSNFSLTNFTAASADEAKDNKKNNILKITTKIASSKVAEVASANYYYSHIEGKQFTYFLPALNKLEILALSSDIYNNISLSASSEDPESEQYYISHIFSSTSSDDPESDNYYIGKRTFEGIKPLLEKVKGQTYKGFALLGFNNIVNENDTQYKIIEEELYPGSFILTFNSLLEETFNPDSSTDNYFSMKIELDEETTEVKDLMSKGALPAIASKPKIKTIEIKDINFMGRYEADSSKSYSSDNSSSANIQEWATTYLHANMLAFSSEEDSLSQIAGVLTLQRGIEPEGSISYYIERILVSFASNEVFKPGDAGYVDVNDELQ